MSYSQPMGYRFPSTMLLPSISRALERFGWPVWREETVRALAEVTLELLDPATSRDDVFRRLSHNQIGEADLVISQSRHEGLLHRAAEFLDVGHALMHRPSATPLPSWLDLRCQAQFMDDPEDPDRAWTYALFGTEHDRLQRIFSQLRGTQEYPLPPEDSPPEGADPAEWRERAATWHRVLAPYARYSPLSIHTPEPQVMFDIVESLSDLSRDAQLAASGKVTVTQAVATIRERLADAAPPDLHERLVARIST